MLGADIAGLVRAMLQQSADKRGMETAPARRDEIVAAKPELDHTRYQSVEELKSHGLQHLRDAVAVLEQKATPDEVEEYRTAFGGSVAASIRDNASRYLISSACDGRRVFPLRSRMP